MLDERGDIAPFGWAIACSGRQADRVDEDVHALVEWATREWTRHFPAERGYTLRIEPATDSTPGVRLVALRGDFRAEVAIECDHSATTIGAPTRTSTRSAIRAFGGARSEIVHHAHEWSQRAIARCRIIGSAAGIGTFISLAWLMIGVSDPIYVLGGMLLVVALLLTLMAGGTLGTWFGEYFARHRQAWARNRVARDVGIDADIRRWKAVSRKLAAQRSMLQRRRGQPFRVHPQALAS